MRVVEVRGHVREAVDEPAVEQDLRRAFGVGAVLCVRLLRGLDDHWGREEGRGGAVVVRGRRRGGSVLIRPIAVASKTEAEGRARRGAVGGLVLLCGVALIRALRARRIARARELGRQLGREGVRACMHVRRRRRSRERSSSTPILRGRRVPILPPTAMWSFAGARVEGDIVGKGCRPLSGPGGDDGLDGEAALALLPLRPRYSAMRSWNEVFTTGGKLAGDTLLRSSADLDHPRREIVRKSPSPPPPLGPLIGLGGCAGCVESGVFPWILAASRIGQAPSWTRQESARIPSDYHATRASSGWR